MAWSDPSLQRLATAFVPGADEVHRLQTGTDADCRLFQRFCDKGHYRRPETTRQGLYAVAPNGVLLASCNERQPDRVTGMLEYALEVWRDLPPEQRRLDDSTRAGLAALWRWDDEYPEAGLALEVTVRDLPRDEQAQPAAPRRRRSRWTAQAWNVDQAWFRADEVAAWIPARLEPGVTRAVAEPLVERLVRFHLLDCVRGQTLPFDRDDITRAELTTEIIAVDGDRVALRLSGATSAEGEGDRGVRGLATALHGTAQWDRSTTRFTQFELVAQGHRWGRTAFNEREHDADVTPIGVVLRLADGAAPRVAPAFIWSYGWRPLRR